MYISLVGRGQHLVKLLCFRIFCTAPSSAEEALRNTNGQRISTLLHLHGETVGMQLIYVEHTLLPLGVGIARDASAVSVLLLQLLLLLSAMRLFFIMSVSPPFSTLNRHYVNGC